MTVAAFDTLKAAEALAEAGIEERHAKAIANTMRDAVTEGVATKGDIARLEARIAELKVTMLLAMVALAGVIVAAITLLP